MCRCRSIQVWKESCWSRCKEITNKGGGTIKEKRNPEESLGSVKKGKERPPGSSWNESWYARHFLFIIKVSGNNVSSIRNSFLNYFSVKRYKLRNRVVIQRKSPPVYNLRDFALQRWDQYINCYSMPSFCPFVIFN